MSTQLDGRQIKDDSIPASKIIGGVGGGSGISEDLAIAYSVSL